MKPCALKPTSAKAWPSVCERRPSKSMTGRSAWSFGAAFDIGTACQPSCVKAETKIARCCAIAACMSVIELVSMR